MKNTDQYFGCYYYFGLALHIKSSGSQLVAAMHGIPEGYEIILQPLEVDHFRSHGGPIDGSIVKFVRDHHQDVCSLQTGQFELMKIDPEQLEELPLTQWLFAPDLHLTSQKKDDFEQLIKSCLERDDGGWIPYDLPYPKHEFIQYVSEKDLVIFHGSNVMDITTFQPLRKSMELMDATGRGNVEGVYGTHDGLWSMFFAVINRSALKGSIRNGVMYFHNQSGSKLTVYNFSINKDQLAEKPVTQGALYLLPRDTFRRLKMTADAFANEWVSEQPVNPIARLRLEPRDFPFLDQISGHDDSEMIRLQSLSAEIRESAIAARLTGNRLVISLPAASDIANRLDEYIALEKKMVPAAGFEVNDSGDSLNLAITNIPPAMVNLLEKSYADLLAD